MPDLIELLTYYVIVLLLFVGAPGVFFSYCLYARNLQNTKGRMVGYKDHKTYGNSTIYEVNRTT